MSFKVNQVIFDDKLLKLSEEVDNDNNVFTLLTGKNASGKTRLLSKIVNQYIFFETAKNNSIIELGQKPNKVIAISNTRFDRFPKKHFLSKNYNDNVYYYRIGIGATSSTAAILTSAFFPLIKRLSRDDYNIGLGDSILRYIGFMPSITVELTALSLPFNKFNELKIKVGPRDAFRIYCKETLNFIPADFDYDYAVFCIESYDIQRQIEKKQSSTIWFDNSQSELFNSLEDLRRVSFLIEYDFLQISDIKLVETRNKKRVSLSHASSGQQCMLLMFLGLSGTIGDNSLICIDEPEVCLHPRWQSEFITLLQKSFASYKGCHFFIATHSPQVVAGLESENGFVVDLEEKQIHSSNDYSNKSADFQLMQVFKEPGYKNEYLIRSLLVVLNKVIKDISISDEEEELMYDLDKLKSRIDRSDPVYHLFNQIKVMSKND